MLTGVVRGVGRQRQGLSHMQSGTVSDIDAVVANCRKALDEAEQMAGLKPGSAVIGIAGELVKGTTSVRTVHRDQPQTPLTQPELERIVQRAQSGRSTRRRRVSRWESGVERMEVRLVHAADRRDTIDGYPVSNPIGLPAASWSWTSSTPSRRWCISGRAVGGPSARSAAAGSDRGAIRRRHLPGSRRAGRRGGQSSWTSAAARPTWRWCGTIAGTKMLALGGRAFTKGLAERFGLSFARAETLKLAASAAELPEAVPAESLQDAWPRMPRSGGGAWS